MKRPTVTAHTGCLDTEMNSMASLEKAVEAGADITEFDLRFTSYGVPVLTHNLPADETCLKLEDAFAYLSDKKIMVNIDAKETTNLAEVERLEKKYGMSERCFFTGITCDDVKSVKEQFPTAVYYLNFNAAPVLKRFPTYVKSVVKKVKSCGAVGLNANFLCLTKSMTAAMHRAGLEVSAWTANDEKTAERLIDMGVDNITTRKPDMVLSMLKENTK